VLGERELGVRARRGAVVSLGAQPHGSTALASAPVARTEGEAIEPDPGGEYIRGRDIDVQVLVRRAHVDGGDPRPSLSDPCTPRDEALHIRRGFDIETLEASPDGPHCAERSGERVGRDFLVASDLQVVRRLDRADGILLADPDRLRAIRSVGARVAYARDRDGALDAGRRRGGIDFRTSGDTVCGRRRRRGGSIDLRAGRPRREGPERVHLDAEPECTGLSGSKAELAVRVQLRAVQPDVQIAHAGEPARHRRVDADLVRADFRHLAADERGAEVRRHGGRFRPTTAQRRLPRQVGLAGCAFGDGRDIEPGEPDFQGVARRVGREVERSANRERAAVVRTEFRVHV